MSSNNKQNASRPKGQRQQGAAPAEPIKVTLDGLSKLQLGRVKNLPHLNKTIVVVFDANGKASAGYLDQPINTKPLDDIKLLTQATRIAKGETTLENKSETVLLARVAAERALVKDSGGVISQQFLNNIGSMMEAMDRLIKNEDILVKNLNQTQKSLEAKEILLYFAARIRIAIERYVSGLIDPKNEFKMNDYLFNQGVPIWVYRKFTSGPMGHTNASALHRIFFPTKIDNGLKLTINELRNQAIVKSCGPLLSNSQLILTLANSDKILTEMTNSKISSDNVNWTKTLGTKMLVTPWVDWDTYVGSTLTAPTLKEASTNVALLERVAHTAAIIYGYLPPQQRIRDFNDVLDKSVIIDETSSESFRVQALKGLKEPKILAALVNIDKFIAIMNLLISMSDKERSLMAAVKIYPTFKEVLAEMPNFILNPDKADWKSIRLTTPYQLLAPSSHELELARNNARVAQHLPLPKIKEKKGTKSSALPEIATRFLRRVSKDEKHKAFRPVYEKYLKAFYEEDIMKAAIKQLEAEIDVSSKEEETYEDYDSEEE